MKITTIPFTNSCVSQDFEGKTVVVIDVLRATSTMITALMHGAGEIIPVVEIEEALEQKKNFPPSELLLCGERSAGIIPGFDLGNSPFDYTSERVAGKTLIMSTTNGTKAINLANKAEELVLASFINSLSLVKYLRKKEDIILFCSGTHGQFSLDDALCAGFIASETQKSTAVEACDLTSLLILNWQQVQHQYSTLIKNCVHGKLLIRKGFEQDIDYCLTTGVTDLIPQYDFQTKSIKPKSLATY